jgi:hypothetical protein
MIRAGFIAVALSLASTGRLPGQQHVRRLTVTQDLRVSAATADLGDPAWLRVRGDGEIVIGQVGDNNIKFFTASGRPDGVFGRGGAGPGEFVDVRHSGWMADTLWISDLALHRVTLVAPSRVALRTTAIPTALVFGAGGADRKRAGLNLYPEAVYPDGSMLVAAIGLGEALGRTATPPGGTDHLRVSFAGDVERAIALEPFSGQFVGEMTVPFSPETESDVAPDGSRFAFAVLSNTDVRNPRFRVTSISARGDTIFNREYAFTPVLISRHFADSVISYGISRTRSAAHAADYRAMHLPAFFPPIDNLMVGRDGTIWLELHAVGAEHDWLELDPHGKPIGELRLPDNVTVQAGQRDRIWALQADDSGAQGIASYRIGAR